MESWMDFLPDEGNTTQAYWMYVKEIDEV